MIENANAKAPLFFPHWNILCEMACLLSIHRSTTVAKNKRAHIRNKKGNSWRLRRPDANNTLCS